MTVSLRTISLSALVVLAVAVPLSAWLGGLWFAAGVLATGALMLVNLWAWSGVVSKAVSSTINGGGGSAAALLYFLKLLALAGGLILLLVTFPALAVLVGCSATVTAVIGVAVVGLSTGLEVGEGYR